MIYLILFAEFFKIGLFAIGGGLVTVPFLFELTNQYDWFSAADLADMIAISESTPGPLGINMATYAGFNAAGFWGGVVATLGLVAPSLIIIILVAKILKKHQQNPYLQRVFCTIRPTVVALILYASLQLFDLAIVSLLTAGIGLFFWAAIHFIKLHPIVYILLGAVAGIILKL